MQQLFVVNVNVLPDYQDFYGDGNSGDPDAAWVDDSYTWKTGDPDDWKSMQGYRRQQYFDDASWGPRFDGEDHIPWYAWYGGHNRSFKPANYEAHPNHIRQFFSAGITTNNNISL